MCALTLVRTPFLRLAERTRWCAADRASAHASPSASMRGRSAAIPWITRETKLSACSGTMLASGCAWSSRSASDGIDPARLPRGAGKAEEPALLAELGAALRPGRGFKVKAVAHQEERGPSRHGPGADRARSARHPVRKRIEGRVHEVRGQGADKGVGAHEVRDPALNRKLEARRDREILAELIAQGPGGLGGVDRQAPIALAHPAPACLHRVTHEALEVRGGSHGCPGLLDLRRDILEADGLLGEDRARALLPLRHGLPLGVEAHLLRLELREEVLLLVRPLSPEDQPLHQGLHDLLAPHRHRHGDAQAASDDPVLAEEHIQHQAVDPVVHGEQGQGAHRFPGLPVAVHPPLALLVARGVPGEVVVHHRVEVLLEVDALAQAVGGHKDVPLRLAQGKHPPLPLLRRKLARHRLHHHVPGKACAELLRHVVGRGDEAAEDHGAEPLFQERPDLLLRGLELGVLRSGEALGLPRHVQEAPPLGALRLPVPGVAARRHVHALRLVHGVQVHDGADAHLVRLILCFGGGRGCPGAERCRGRSGARAQGTEERQDGPPPHPTGEGPALHILHGLHGVGEGAVEERAVARREPVGALPLLPLREGGVRLHELPDVRAASLHELARQAASLGLPRLLREVPGQGQERRVQEPQEGVERLLVPAVRRGRHQDEVPIPRGDLAHQLVPLVARPAPLVPRRAGVRLVHDHELRARPEELRAPPLALDEVQGDHGEGVALEQALPHRAGAFEAGGRAGEHELRVDVELARELALPLLRQRRRAEHRGPAHLPAVQELSEDQAGLNGLADAHVVRDEEAHRVQAQGHEKRHELVRPRLHADARKGTEGPGAGAVGQAHGVPKETAGAEVADLGGVRQAEGRGFHAFQAREDPGLLGLRPAQGPELEQRFRRPGEHHPLAPPGFYQRTDPVAHASFPNTLGYRRMMAAQSS